MLSNFSNFQIIRTAGTNLTVADMLIIKETLSHTFIPIPFFSTRIIFFKQIKNLIKKNVETLLQQNPLSNGTDLYEDDNPVDKKIPEQNSHSPQATLTIHTLQPGIQSQYLNDSYLSQDIITNTANSFSPNFDDFAHNNAIIQFSSKPACSQSFLFLLSL